MEMKEKGKGARIGWWLGLVMLATGAMAAAPPPNDAFSQAEEIVTEAGFPNSVRVYGTTAGATVEPGENLNSELAAANARGTVWWKWTCSRYGYVEFSAATRYANVSVIALKGNAVANLTTLLASEPDPFGYAMVFPNADPSESIYGGGTVSVNPAFAGTTYWFAVMPHAGSSEPAGTVEGVLTYSPNPGEPPPANDHFANREIIDGTNLTRTIHFSNASAEPGEPNSSGRVTVWYEWTSPERGMAYFSLTSVTPSAQISFYRGTSFSTLTNMPTAPDGGVPMQTGEKLLVQAWATIGAGVPVADMRLRFEPPAPTSPNDDFAARLEMTAPTYEYWGSLYGATRQSGEPISISTTQTLWWRFRPDDTGQLTLWVTNAQFAPRVHVYEGTALTALTGQTTASLRGIATYRVHRDREYAIRVSGPYTPGGRFALMARYRSLTNDSFSGSHQMVNTGMSAFAQGNTLDATMEPGEPPLDDVHNTIWFSWAAPATGRASVTPQSVWWHPLRIYTGPALDRLTPVGSSPDFLATQGTVYHFQYGGDDGYFDCSAVVDPFTAPANDALANAIPIRGSGGPWRSQIVGASVDLGEPSHPVPGPIGSVWWRWPAPVNGSFSFATYGSLTTNVTLVAYRGDRLESLTQVAVGSNYFSGPDMTHVLDLKAEGGEVYSIAAVVPTGTVGDVQLRVSGGFSSSYLPVPGNLLGNPSWESTVSVPGEPVWGSSGGLNGYYNQDGGADGRNWPWVPLRTRIWQDVPTIPGRDYRVRFAFRGAGSRVQSLWDDNVLGSAEAPNDGWWNWATFTARASNRLTRVTFSNPATTDVEMDGFSVVDLSAPPFLIRPPSSITAIAGGSAAFIVGAGGSSPLSYQWLRDGAPLDRETGSTLVLDPVSTNDAGTYSVLVTNAFGTASSAAATLTVEIPDGVRILVQPYSDVVQAGGYFSLNTVAAGSPPLMFLWSKDGLPLAGATNRSLVFPSVTNADAGVYQVVVQNSAGSVLSSPARLAVTNAAVGGGLISFRNRSLMPGTPTNDAPIFNFDGVTPLNGDEYLAQLVAGPTIESMRPVGEPSPFRSGFQAGYFVSKIVTLPNVPPDGIALVEIRVWEKERGTSYEEARALGGHFGRSGIHVVRAGTAESLPTIATLTSFSLQTGLPRFNVGRVDYVERDLDGGMIWQLTGEPGFRYSVEKSREAGGIIWKPFVVLTNWTGEIRFRDVADGPSDRAVYRARLLD